MAETVREMVELEVEGSVEEVYDHLARPEVFCEFVRSAEDARRLNFAASRWFFSGPAGRAVRFDPDSFGGCLRGRRRASVDAGEPSEPDLVVDSGTFDFRALSDKRTLLIMTTHFAATKPERPTPSFDLDAIVIHVLRAGFSSRRREENPWSSVVASLADTERPEDGRTAEDRGWLADDLSRLGEWEPYDWAEGELENARPVRYQPGVGFVVEDEEDAPEDDSPEGDSPGA